MHRSPRQLRRLGALFFSLVACLVLAPAALAADGDPILDQCFSPTDISGCTNISPPSFTGMDVEVSPDGKHVYMFGRSPAFIKIFDRGANNKLTPRTGPSSCFNHAGGDCTTAPGFNSSDVYDLEISPDGKTLYAANLSALAVLQRDPASGNLTPAGCYGTHAGCTPIAPVGTVLSVVVSPDNQNVYTRGGGTFGVFERDPSTGLVTPEDDGEDCFTEQPTAGCADTYGLAGNAFEMKFSPDGKFLYYPIQSPGGVGFFQRATDGTLSQISGPQGGCITTNGNSSVAGECATIPDGSGPAMGNGWAVTLSPSGKILFISGSSGTIVFSRSADTGKLTKTDCIAPNAITACSQRRGSAGMGVEVAPNSSMTVVGGGDIGGVGVYTLDENAGKLTQLPDPVGCFSGPAVAGCGSFPGGANRTKVAWAPDGLNFYAVANSPLNNFVLDFAPTCDSKSVTVPFQTSTLVSLSCSDRNGHAIDQYQTVTQPSAGQLGSVQGTTVRYNPFSGFSGADSFTYTATSRGLTSTPATVSLNVEGPPPPPPVTDADGDGIQPPLDCDDNNPNIKPTTPEILDNGVDENCDGIVGASPPRRIVSSIDFLFDARNRRYTKVNKLDVTNVPAGATITVRCRAKKGCKFKTKTLAIKAQTAKASVKKFFNFTKKLKKKKGQKKARRKKIVSKLTGGTIQIAITAPNHIGKLVVFKILKGKVPTFTVSCLTPGSSTAKQACPTT